jgi:hypothetical protein
VSHFLEWGANGDGILCIEKRLPVLALEAEAATVQSVLQRT